MPAVERALDELAKFVPPSETTPVDTSVLLKQSDLSFLGPVLQDFYEKTPTYDPEALLKAEMYAKRRGFGPRRLWRFLKANPEVARRLGFVRNGEVKIPSRETFRQFRQKRVDWDRIRDATVAELGRRLKAKGIPFAENAAEDTTMIETLANDPDATYNPHYEKEGVKEDFVTCTATGLPVGNMVIGGLDFDGRCTVPQLEQLRSLGLKVKALRGDNHYATLSNIAVLKVVYGTDLRYQVQEEWTIRDDGTEERLKKLYQELRAEPDFQPGASLEEMMSFLVRKGRGLIAKGGEIQNDALARGAWGERKRKKRGRPSKAELAAQAQFAEGKSVENRGKRLVDAVGAYFRNIRMGEAAADPEAHKKDKGPRQWSESMNDLLKNDLGLQAALRVKGKEKVHRHVTAGVVFILLMALVKVENGITENLASLVGVE